MQSNPAFRNRSRLLQPVLIGGVGAEPGGKFAGLMRERAPNSWRALVIFLLLTLVVLAAAAQALAV